MNELKTSRIHCGAFPAKLMPLFSIFSNFADNFPSINQKANHILTDMEKKHYNTLKNYLFNSIQFEIAALHPPICVWFTFFFL